MGIASSRRCSSTARASGAAAACRAADRAADGVERRPFELAALRLELGGTGVVALDLAQAGTGLLRVRRDVGERVAVLPAEVAQELAATAHVLEPLRVVGDLLGGEPQLVFDVGDLGLRGADARAQLGERRATVELRDGDAERVERGTFERRVRAPERVAVRGGVGEEELLGFERDFLARIVDCRRASISFTWNRSRSISRARACASPPSAARSSSTRRIPARAARIRR